MRQTSESREAALAEESGAFDAYARGWARPLL